MDGSKIRKGAELILEGLLGPEWDADENYIDTPARVQRFYEEFFRDRNFAVSTFPQKVDQMIVVSHHKTWTMCPHHLLPVGLDVSLAYLPKQDVLGLSKLVRLIENHLTEPQLQETLTDSIADELMRISIPQPLGSAVSIYGNHLCMQMRGVHTSAEVHTSALRGVFLEKPEVREEFFWFVRKAR